MHIPRREFLRTSLAATSTLAIGAQPELVQKRLPLRDVVILIPGIMGSVLSKDGRDVWSLTGSSIADSIRTLGKNISTLTMSGDDPGVDDLRDGVTATSVIADVQIFPGLWKIDGYTRVSTYIMERFDAIRGKNFFEFPYDWRRDNRVAARKLAKASHKWLNEWHKSSGNESARLILIAHSMGGLVSRHFLEFHGGWKDTRMLVTFGTPYRGSAKALNCLTNGISQNIGPLTVFDFSSLVRSFTSTYQLLPTYKCYDDGQGTLSRVAENKGIPNVEQARAKAALQFHDDITKKVTENAKLQGYLSNRYLLHPIVGNYQPTIQSGKLVGRKVQMSLSLGSDTRWRGDGTVPEASARPIETPELEATHRTVYSSEMHGSLQNSDPILTHLGGLLGEVSQNSSVFRGPELGVVLMLEDIFTIAEGITVRAQCEDPGAQLTATVVSCASSKEISSVALQAREGFREAQLKGLPEGAYRIRVSGGSNVRSVSDVCLVLKP